MYIMSYKVPAILKSKTSMWVSTILTTLVIIGYAASGDSEAIAIFGLVAILTSLVTKNPALIMMSALFFTSLSTLTLGTVEAFEDQKKTSGKEKAKKRKESADVGKDSRMDKGPKPAKSESSVEKDTAKVTPDSSVVDKVKGKMGGILDQTSSRLDNINSMIDKVEGLMNRLQSMG